MKKRTLSKLKSIFSSKKGKHSRQPSNKSSRTPSPARSPPRIPSNEDVYRAIPRTPPPPPSRVGPPPSPPVPTRPIAPVAPEPSGPIALSPCSICGRTFVPESLSKHVKICEKMLTKKRKTFDSSRQRREGTDLEQFLPKNFGLPENSPFLEKSPPNTAKIAPKVHKPSVKNAITKPMAELQRCPHCSRAFGVRAFERHVEWCADKAKILPATPAPAQQQLTAKQRLNARTQYKAPLVRGRRSSQSRDKSSNSRSASVESSRGVSPPRQRDSGDYRRGRVRASESMSSNDFHEESPHVPVIKNTRSHMSGDANVKARQARLARDLSSSRNTQEKQPSNPPSKIQQSNTEPNLPSVQKESNKPKTRLDVKKQQQLKKLEKIVSRYNERNQTTQNMDKRRQDKSQIPIPRKKVTDIKTQPNDEVNNIIMVESEDIQFQERNKEMVTNKIEIVNPRARNKRQMSQNKQSSVASVEEKKRPRVLKANTGNVKQKPTLRKKDINMSVDSLNEPAQTNISNSQSIGINTELLCPCIPCVIHESDSTDKKRSKNKGKSAIKERRTEPQPEPKVVLLFKNLSVVSSCDLQPKFQYKEEEPMIVESISSLDINSVSNTVTSTVKQSDVTFTKKSQRNSKCFETVTTSKDEPPHINNEIVIDNYSDVSFSDSIELVKETSEKIINEHGHSESIIGGRHGSGDTYTKFSENPEDLQEFMSLTDKMINEQTGTSNDDDLFISERDVHALHTPNTVSVETITKNLSDCDNTEEIPIKPIFSENFEELKKQFKLLLTEAGNDTVRDAVHKNDEVENSKRVSDMEHITVYELKTNERKQNAINEQPTDTKLPKISVNNKTVPKSVASRKKPLRPHKQSKKYQMLCEQNKNNAENKTFVKSPTAEHSDDGLSISSEAPPLKLPRIDNRIIVDVKRIEDNYDPFASAARQMKELMSSESNLPKKVDNSLKNRTLPILRPSKDKTFPADNSKMIKDTLNKSYQKTPTLQRMKSFGSPANENNSSFGSRCSSFRMSKNNNNKSSQKLNTTFTKSSKENISSMDKTYFNRNSNLNRSFSSYTTSNYSTPKLKDKIPKITTSLYHSFQRNTIKQPVKLDKIKIEEPKKDFVNLDVILTNDNTSMTDSNYIDPRLINENDNLPINVTTILNNPDIISSMESLLTTENLPSKFDSFSNSVKNNNLSNKHLLELSKSIEAIQNKNSLNKITTVPILDDLNSQYDKILSSLEQSMTSKTSGRDDDSLCEDFDLEEFMTSFDDEVIKQSETKRTCSSTTRIVHTDNIDCNKSEYVSVTPSPQIISNSNQNGLLPVNKSMSLNFSSNNVVGENLFPSSVKRSTSLLDSLQKKGQKMENSARNRQRTDQLEQDIMQSLKDFDKIYETDKKDLNRDVNANHYTDTVKRAPREKGVKKNKKNENVSNGSHTPNGKTSSDSAYSSLNRISPSKLSTYNGKDNNGVASLEQIPAESDSSDKEDARSLSSEEFLAMERSAELADSLHKTVLHPTFKEEEKRTSRPSSRRSSTWRGGVISSSGSESSLRPAAPATRPSAPAAPATRPSAPAAPATRPSRFCHECGERFPVDTAKFCVQCGVKRLVV